MTDRGQSEPFRGIGIPDGKYHPRQTHCAGATMHIDRASYVALASTVVWETPEKDIPDDGARHDARVTCGGQEVTVQRGSVTYGYALCRPCAKLESEYRKELRPKT